MKTHNLKTWPEFFKAVKDGRKRFEIRQNDRKFEAGDIVILDEYDPEKKSYCGEALFFKIGYMTEWAQRPGFVVFQLEPLKHPTPAPNIVYLCRTCGIGYYLPSGHCDHCDCLRPPPLPINCNIGGLQLECERIEADFRANRICLDEAIEQLLQAEAGWYDKYPRAEPDGEITYTVATVRERIDRCR